MTEQEEKVLNLCREWYRKGKEITKQTLWYEIGVMIENEDDVYCKCTEPKTDILGMCLVCGFPVHKRM